MKNPSHRLVLTALLFIGSNCSLLAQNYTLDWFTIDAGGGTSTGGSYSLTATIGQPDAGPVMTGGDFSVSGGFWVFSAVQTAGTPLLTIAVTPTNTVLVSWPSPSTGFNLQQSTDLNGGAWTTPSETVNDDGTTKYIVVNPPAGNRFYRLLKP